MVPSSQKFKSLLVLFLSGMVLLNGLVLWRAWWEVLAGYPDFSIFYTAGLMLRRGQGATLYDNTLQLQVQREFASAARGRPGPLPYNHPPFEAAIFVPLTHFPYLASYALWALLNLCLLAGVVFFMRPPPRHPARFPWFWLLAALAFFPVAYALMQGQDSIMLLALYCLAYKALRRGHDLQAGMWLGLGLFKFHLVLPFVFILLLRRRLRAIFGVLLSGCFDLLISGMLVGWREVLRYPHYVWQVNRHSPMRVIVPENMPNLRGLFTGWAGAQSASHWLELIVLFVSLGLLIWAAWQWDPADSASPVRWENGISIALLVTFLVGYHGYNQDMSILFLPVLLLSQRMLQNPAPGRHHLALRICLGLMFFTPVYVVLTLHYQQEHLFACVLLGLAAILAAQNRALQRGLANA